MTVAEIVIDNNLMAFAQKEFRHRSADVTCSARY